MNKLICDVCGTMYPENASQCPICGCAKPAESAAVPAEGMEAEIAAGAYTHTKGGRFSKSNVRKRNKTVEKAPKAAPVKKVKEQDNAEAEEKSGESNKGLIIAIILLMIAIVGMLCYILFTYFADDLFGGATEPVNTTTAPTVTTQQEIKCEDLDIQVPNNEITLDKVDHVWLLNVVATPADTTDTITYTSSDPSVAVVSADGRVTAVGAGTATITITCGDVVKQCQVVCNIETEPTTEATTEATEPETEPTTEPTEPSTEPTTKPEVDLSKFYIYPRADCTIDIDETFTLQLRDGNGKKVDVTWTATVEGYFEIDGYKITGLKATPSDPNAADKVRATCTYEGVEFSCIIRVRGKAPAVTDQPTEPPEYTGPTIDDPGYEISHSDVTIRGGEKFVLTLQDSNGQPVEAVWTSSKGGIVTINGNTITGATKGTTIVSFRVANYVYECIVRVSSTASDDSVG